MTTDETLRATLFAIETLQIEVLRLLQSGKLKGSYAIELLRHLHASAKEFEAIRAAAVHSPELYDKYAAPGNAANEPSEN